VWRSALSEGASLETGREIGRLFEKVLFLKQAVRRHHTTGAIWPSSGALARSITRLVAAKSRPARILEVGPGTGAFTREIAQHLCPDDELVLVEINPDFVAVLQHLIEHHPALRQHQDRIRIICAPVETAPLSAKFDYVISGLPLNNFDPALVRRILRRFRALAEPGGKLSFFEYYGLRRLRMSLGRQQTRSRLREIEAVIRVYERRYGLAREVVLRNFPPALVRHWCFDEPHGSRVR